MSPPSGVGAYVTRKMDVGARWDVKQDWTRPLAYIDCIASTNITQFGTACVITAHVGLFG